MKRKTHNYACVLSDGWRRQVNQLANCPRGRDKGPDDEEGKDEATPYLITSRQLEGKAVLATAAGSQHSVFLGWDSQYARAKTSGPKPVKRQLMRDLIADAPPAKKPRKSYIVPASLYHSALADLYGYLEREKK